MFFNKYTKIRDVFNRVDKNIATMYRTDAEGFILVLGSDLEYRAANNWLKYYKKVEVSVHDEATYALLIRRVDK